MRQVLELSDGFFFVHTVLYSGQQIEPYPSECWLITDQHFADLARLMNGFLYHDILQGQNSHTTRDGFTYVIRSFTDAAKEKEVIAARIKRTTLFRWLKCTQHKSIITNM